MTATLGQRIREAIRIRAGGVSQNEVERRAGLNPGQLSMLINDRRKRPNVDQIRALATALGISFTWLATGKGDMLFDEAKFATELGQLTGQTETRPNCLVAAQLARAAGYDERAITRIVDMRHTWREDIPVLEWAWLMKSYNDVVDLVLHTEEELNHRFEMICAEAMNS